jgi:hypothetical protein
MPIIDRLLAASTEEEAAAALAGVSGGIANRDRSDGLLTAMAQVRGNNLGYEGTRATTANTNQRTSNLVSSNARANASSAQGVSDREEAEARAAYNLQVVSGANTSETDTAESSFNRITPDAGTSPTPTRSNTIVPDADVNNTAVQQPSVDRNKTLRPTGKAGEEGKDVPTPRNFEPGTETLGFGSAVDDAILRSGINLQAGTGAPTDGRIVPPTPLLTRDNIPTPSAAGGAQEPVVQPDTPTEESNVSRDIDAILQAGIDSGDIDSAEQYTALRQALTSAQTGRETEARDEQSKAEAADNTSFIQNLTADRTASQEDDLFRFTQRINEQNIPEARKQTLRTSLGEFFTNNGSMYGQGDGPVSDQGYTNALGADVGNTGSEAVTEARAVADDLANGGTLGDTGLTDDMRAAVSQAGDVPEQEYPSNQADFMVYFNDNFNSSDLELVDFDKTTGQLQSLQTQTGVPMSLLVPLTRNSFGDPSSFNGKAGLDMDAMMRQLAPLLSEVTDENGSVTNRYSEEAYLELRATQRAVDGHSARSDEAFAEYEAAGQAMSDLLAQSGGEQTKQNKQELNQLAQQRFDAGTRIQEATNNLKTAAGLLTPEEQVAKDEADAQDDADAIREAQLARNPGLIDGADAAISDSESAIVDQALLREYSRPSSIFDSGDAEPLSDRAFDQLKTNVNDLQSAANVLTGTNDGRLPEIESALDRAISEMNAETGRRQDELVQGGGYSPSNVTGSKIPARPAR